ncbi:uncharacterized protein SCHCODRAFT_01287405 [Schizophyllum commune H4-8]|uniref:uncharacterized protein n=1 Tax=Schizophyllum commune (strain H4-8 / FGSC 9210) TaxID=578458 RepID=UPI00215ED628|nr:uncharacterized protein SCHCODRAFT_01287405 [Schizophyllum commune H4-8]KAI5895796.1 hypothetical protein SCHCODRAFT_01287405 [Schizophyllum commune H4-8]
MARSGLETTLTHGAPSTIILVRSVYLADRGANVHASAARRRPLPTRPSRCWSFGRSTVLMTKGGTSHFLALPAVFGLYVRACGVVTWAALWTLQRGVGSGPLLHRGMASSAATLQGRLSGAWVCEMNLMRRKPERISDFYSRSRHSRPLPDVAELRVFFVLSLRKYFDAR